MPNSRKPLSEVQQWQDISWSSWLICRCNYVVVITKRTVGSQTVQRYGGRLMMSGGRRAGGPGRGHLHCRRRALDRPGCACQEPPRSTTLIWKSGAAGCTDRRAVLLLGARLQRAAWYGSHIYKQAPAGWSGEWRCLSIDHRRRMSSALTLAIGLQQQPGILQCRHLFIHHSDYFYRFALALLR